MKLHAHTDYALQILQHLHKNKDVLHTAASLSESIGVPYPTVVKIASRLKQKNLLKSIPGRRGGYQLGKPSHKINTYDVFICMEGELQAHSLHGSVRDMQEEMIEKMINMSIADMVSDNLTGRIKQGLHYMTQVLKTPEERLYRIETIDKRDYDIPFDEIILIQSSSQQGILELHRAHGLLEFRGRISRIALDIPEFFYSHTSVVVNVNHIKEVVKDSRELILTNGRVVPIAARKIPLLSRLMAAQMQSID